MPGPLDGVKVVDVSQVAFGPFATMILADQGADVVKIEPPGIGESTRRPSFERGGLTAVFANYNRNKRGMAVDITEPEGLKIVHRLVADADLCSELAARRGRAAQPRRGRPAQGQA